MAFTIVAVALGVVLGIACGGRVRNVGRRPMRGMGALVAGVALQVAPDLAGGVEGRGGLALVLASYALLVAFALVNLRLVGMPVVLVGLCLNFAVIAANGAMPVRATSLLRADVVDTPAEADDLDLGAKRRLEEPGDRLVWLGDVVPVPGVRTVASFGDLVLGFGVLNVVFRLLRPLAARRREDATLPEADVVVFPPQTVQPLRRSA